MIITLIEISNEEENDVLEKFTSDCLLFMSQDELDHILFDSAEIYNDEKEIALSFLSEQITNKFIYCLKSYNMYISHKNITSEVLKNYKKDNDSVYYNDFFPLDMYSKVLLLFQEYFMNNLTKDDILDKISTSGINSLSDIDKFILDEQD